MAKSVSRYKLVFHYNNGGTRDFTFFGENGEVRNKFTLTEIDVFTSNFSSSDEMARALNSVFPVIRMVILILNIVRVAALNRWNLFLKI